MLIILLSCFDLICFHMLILAMEHMLIIWLKKHYYHMISTNVCDNHMKTDIYDYQITLVSYENKMNQTIAFSCV